MEVDICPYVRFSMHHIWMKGMYLDRITWDNEIIFIERGSMKYITNGKTYILKENDLVIIRPGVRHVIEYAGEECSQPHVHFDFYQYPDKEEVGLSTKTYEDMSEEERTHIRPDYFKENGLNVPDVLHLKDPTMIKNLLFEIISVYSAKNQYYQYQLTGLMTQLIGAVLTEASNITEKKDTFFINSIINYMHECVDYNISLDDIASQFNISKWKIISMFNKELNTTPQKEYNRIRYKRAKDLVSYSFMTISEIANLMGFIDVHTFSRWFKNIDGAYPTTYRKK